MIGDKLSDQKCAKKVDYTLNLRRKTFITKLKIF